MIPFEFLYTVCSYLFTLSSYVQVITVEVQLEDLQPTLSQLAGNCQLIFTIIKQLHMYIKFLKVF